MCDESLNDPFVWQVNLLVFYTAKRFIESTNFRNLFMQIAFSSTMYGKKRLSIISDFDRFRNNDHINIELS